MTYVICHKYEQHTVIPTIRRKKEPGGDDPPPGSRVRPGRYGTSGIFRLYFVLIASMTAFATSFWPAPDG